MLVGVLSDTHVGGDIPNLPSAVLRAFQGTDLILHCGDLDTTTQVLDDLETVAPVKAVRGYPDPREEGDRLAESVRVVEVEGIRIGMIHDINWPGPPVEFVHGRNFPFLHRLEFPPGQPIQNLLKTKFGQPVEVVAFGDSHEEYIAWYQGVLFVNPGSATLPGIRHKRGEPGTVALLDIRNGVVTPQIVKLASAPQGEETGGYSAGDDAGISLRNVPAILGGAPAFPEAVPLAQPTTPPDQALERDLKELSQLYHDLLSDLPGISFQSIVPGSQSTYSDFAILVDEYEFGLTRDQLAQALQAENIVTGKYIPPPLHQQRADAQDEGALADSLAVAETASSQVLGLPTGPHLEEETIQRICEAIIRIYEQRAGVDAYLVDVSRH